MNGDEAGDAAAFGEDFADAMARSLGRGQADIDIGGGKDGLEVNVEAMGKEEQLAGGEVGGDLVGVNFGLRLVGGEDHDHVAPRCGLGHRGDLKAGFLRLGDGLGAGGEADFHLNSGVLEVECVGMSLGTVADDGYLLGLDERKVSVVVVVSLCHLVFDSSFAGKCCGCICSGLGTNRASRRYQFSIITPQSGAAHRGHRGGD